MKAILIILASLGLASDNLYFITTIGVLVLLISYRELKKDSKENN